MDAVTEVKAKLNIEDVIGEYVSLKRAGKNYKGLSPFSNEKTPSFVVSPEKQIWHDFSSGRGGDIFTFVQEVEGLDFKGALELLARKAGVDLSKFQTNSGSGNPKQKERLYEVLEASAKFYQVQLKANQKALDYIVKKRAFKKQTILDFKLGYSPDGGSALVDYLAKKGFSFKEISEAGLSVNRSGRTTDMFRGRIMIALCDQFGKVIGFTARLLNDDDALSSGAPKYINTPSTLLYDKSRHVYGLHLAKKAIQTEKFSVLVEGNLDVVSSHQAGVANVVATAGTALTDQQLKLLGRFSPDVRLAFDEDKAGMSATERAIPIASKAGVNLSVVTIPSGKDPDELVRQDPEIWKNVINEQVYALDWLIETYKNQLDIKSAVGKKQFAETILPVVQKLENNIEKDHYLQQIAKTLDIDVSAVKATMIKENTDVKRLKQVKISQNDISNNLQEIRKVGDQLISLTLMLPKSRLALNDVNEDMFGREETKKLFKFLRNNKDFDGNVKEADDLNEIKDYVKIATLHFEELYASVDPIELYYEAARLRTRLIEFYVKDQKQQIISLMQDLDETEARKHLERVKQLDALLKQSKE